MSYIFFLFLVGSIFLLSRFNINFIFNSVRPILRKDALAYIFISVLVFPGTVLHEAAHAVMATALLLKVRSIDLFPHWEKDHIRLGSVLYEKKDPVRAIIVGIAPLFAGMAFFYAVYWFSLFPGSRTWITLAVGYLIFTVSSTMFSSRQDLKDSAIALPIIILIGGIVYVIFGLDWLTQISPFIEKFLSKINLYLLFSVLIHIILLVTVKITRSFFKI